jgi:alanyl-tRNA synthetase
LYRSSVWKSRAGLSGKGYKDNAETVKAFRIIADHIRCAVFILGDQRGVTPSNLGQGYILRRLIRRAIRYSMQLGIPDNGLIKVAESVLTQYGGVYPELTQNRENILSELSREEERFAQALKNGMREFERIKDGFTGGAIDGASAFRLYDTFGFPIEFTEEMAKENGLSVDREGFLACFEEHQKKSHAGAEQIFKGGLADHAEATTELHTATHLLQAALRSALNDSTISQKGSNITAERLRFDFSFPRKLTAEELAEVERLVNEAIQRDLPITCEEMTVDEAKAKGAIGLFESKYGTRVKVYTMGFLPRDMRGAARGAHGLARQVRHQKGRGLFRGRPQDKGRPRQRLIFDHDYAGKSKTEIPVDRI